MGVAFQPFTCCECGGVVQYVASAGRFLQTYPDVPPLPVPDHLRIPTCNACGEVYFSPEHGAAELDAALEVARDAWQQRQGGEPWK